MRTAMATKTVCRARAEECIKLAIVARSPEQRVMLRHIAETWMRFADEQSRHGGFNLVSNGTVHSKA
jgi:hypothetical protein